MAEITQAELDCIIYFVENDSTMIAAYEQCFEVGTLSRNAISKKAEAFFKKPKIKAKLEEIKALVERQRSYRLSPYEQQRQLSEAASRIAISKDWVLQQHIETFLMAKQAVPVLDAFGNETGIFAADYKAMRGALVEIGKLEDMYPSQKKSVDVNVTLRNMTDDVLADEMRAIAKEEAELKQLLESGNQVVEGEFARLLLGGDEDASGS